METHGSSSGRSKKERESSRSSRDRRRRRRASDSDLSQSDSGSHAAATDSDSPSRESSPPSRSSNRRRRSRSRRRKSDDSDSEEDERRKSKKKRKITDEQIAEYMAKKAERRLKKAAKKLNAKQKLSSYSNDSNPFGDSNLNEKFIWEKKIHRDISRGVPLESFSLKAEKERQKERIAEIEKVKKRREERAIEKAQREEEMALLARERARAEFQDWEKKEEEFHFDQSKTRTKIRIQQGRIKPIDVLIKQLDPSDDFDIEINEPYMVFKGLTMKEIEELQEDIKLHLDLDRATETHVQYWEALLVVCNWELAEARKRDAMDRARVRGEHLPPELQAEERGLHSSIETDVKLLLQGKSYGELEALQSQIESQMQSGTAKVVEYWEAVLKRLQIFKAKACLKEIHAKMLRKYLERLETPSERKDDEKDLEFRHDEEDLDYIQKDDRAVSAEPVLNEDTKEEEVEEEQEDEDDDDDDDDDEDDNDGSYSPVLVQDDEKEEAIDPEEDRAMLEKNRMAVLEERRLQDMIPKPKLPEDNFEKKALKAMGAMEEGDAVFGSNDEVNLDSQVYWWHDKYRPRKPKYFNRVHTGYEWNKYNQTHYDHDNPPPKIVQGYKFNIFYPDLVDKSKAPTYVIEKDGDSVDTCIIKFHAGPPYEDIAFRIVNREWEYSHKKGFKCIFDRGILHLYFNFKRYRYRR
ncbi:PREDICTED: cactin [Ipomoea nil]|uniref:cactin n=1 Tax=Ipomoea nil TaxID=35883 RepID=UPI000900A392|nr:PREDICTED: cactin [Ipomoea nil]